jgi:hypothetical protein
MNAAIDRIKLIFLGLFVVACAAIFGYHYYFVWPKQRCEAHGDWWDDRDRVCAIPMPIWSFTHRMPGQPAPHPGAETAASKARPAAHAATAKPADKPKT